MWSSRKESIAAGRVARWSRTARSISANATGAKCASIDGARSNPARHPRRGERFDAADRLVVGVVDAILVRQPDGAEGAHRLDHRQQGMTLARQGVLDAGGHLGEAGAADDAHLLQPLQPLGERLRTDPAQRAFQLAKAPLAPCQVAHDQGRPLVADDLGRPGDRTTEIGRGVHGCLVSPPAPRRLRTPDRSREPRRRFSITVKRIA